MKSGIGRTSPLSRLFSLPPHGLRRSLGLCARGLRGMPRAKTAAGAAAAVFSSPFRQPAGSVSAGRVLRTALQFVGRDTRQHRDVAVGIGGDAHLGGREQHARLAEAEEAAEARHHALDLALGRHQHVLHRGDGGRRRSCGCRRRSACREKASPHPPASSPLAMRRPARELQPHPPPARRRPRVRHRRRLPTPASRRRGELSSASAADSRRNGCRRLFAGSGRQLVLHHRGRLVSGAGGVSCAWTPNATRLAKAVPAGRVLNISRSSVRAAAKRRLRLCTRSTPSGGQVFPVDRDGRGIRRDRMQKSGTSRALA